MLEAWGCRSCGTWTPTVAGLGMTQILNGYGLLLKLHNSPHRHEAGAVSSNHLTTCQCSYYRSVIISQNNPSFRHCTVDYPWCSRLSLNRSSNNCLTIRLEHTQHSGSISSISRCKQESRWSVNSRLSQLGCESILWWLTIDDGRRRRRRCRERCEIYW